jgi:hypothetical protein
MTHPPRAARNFLLPVIAVAVAVGIAHAQSIKPGLWESKSKMTGSPEMEAAMAQAQKQLAAMPPEQRKQMEAMLAKQGMGSSQGKDGETVTRICMTKEMVDRKAPPAMQPGCTATASKFEGNKQTYGFSCPGKGAGEGVVTFRSDTEFHTAMTMTADDPRAQAMTMKIDATSRFVSSDCGDVKPLPVPK